MLVHDPLSPNATRGTDAHVVIDVVIEIWNDPALIEDWVRLSGGHQHSPNGLGLLSQIHRIIGDQEGGHASDSRCSKARAALTLIPWRASCKKARGELVAYIRAHHLWHFSVGDVR